MKSTGVSIATSTTPAADRSISSETRGTKGRMLPVITSAGMSAMAEVTADIIVNKTLTGAITDAGYRVNRKNAVALYYEFTSVIVTICGLPEGTFFV